MGCLFIFGGMFRSYHGVFIVTNWYGQPFSSHLMVVGGAMTVLVALIPSGWIEKTVRRAWTHQTEILCNEDLYRTTGGLASDFIQMGELHAICSSSCSHRI